MKAKCNSWGSALALIGIMALFNASNFAGAQEEMGDFAAAADFSLATGIATDSTGAVYVANSHNTILKITPTGVVMAFAGKPDARGTADGFRSAAGFVFPIGIATDVAANIYVADKVSNTIRKVTPMGEVTTLAGTAGIAGHADGANGNASFFSPASVAADAAGNVYVADYGNNTIREVTPTGVVTTIAGVAGESGELDGIGAAARFTTPYSIATDAAGNLFVAEISSQTIRKITPEGVVTTLAGKAGQPGHADGVGTDAHFSSPHGVATDNAGNVYVADYGNNTVRKITPVGVVTTLAGSADADLSTESDGVGPAATFLRPMALATDREGNVFVLEANNIREVTPTGRVTTFVGSLFGPWHLQNQFCEWDVPLERSGAIRSGTRRCLLDPGTTYCSSSLEVTSANPQSARPKLSLVYNRVNSVTEVDTTFKLEPGAKEVASKNGDPPAGTLATASRLHFVVTITVSSTSSCK